MTKCAAVAIAVLVRIASSPAAALPDEPPNRVCPMDGPVDAQQLNLMVRLDAVEHENPVLRAAPLEINVPVWVHVITDGEKGSVPKRQIDEQIAALNSMYAPHNVRFHLLGTSTVDNRAWFTMGYGSKEEREAKTALSKQGGLLNIYTAKLPGDLLGWATWPWDLDAEPKMDGVVIHVDTMPGGTRKPFDLGMTCVHEVGHWLGLLHTFHGKCQTPGDEVHDTPSEESPATQCPNARDSCPRDDGMDPIHNFMDYANDDCMNEFTNGQRIRFGGMTAAYRPSLLSPPTLTKLSFVELVKIDAASAAARRGAPSLEFALRSGTVYAEANNLGWGKPILAKVVNGSDVRLEFLTPEDESKKLGSRALLVEKDGIVKTAPRR